MDAKGIRTQSESGQSILEFLLFLPLLISLAMTLIRINTAIQISLVNQQYSRAQALALTFHSPHYPMLQFRDLLLKQTSHQLVIGVSDNPATESYVPQATTQLITRFKNQKGSDSSGEEPAKRGKVRIRNTVTLCAPSFLVSSSSGGMSQVLALQSGSFNPIGTSGLTEQSKWNTFCRSKLKYEQ